MDFSQTLQNAMSKPFGVVLADKMALAWFRDGSWSGSEIRDYGPISLMPAAHVFHYASSCFEGMKAYLWEDGQIRFFRMESHIARMLRSAAGLCLPAPDPDQLRTMIHNLVKCCRHWVPASPGSLYIRPFLIGTQSSIGAAAQPSSDACLMVLLAPVGEYFSKGLNPLRLAIETEHMRTSPEIGNIKGGANYAAALRVIIDSRKANKVDQILFAPNGDVQETGATNFMLINDEEIVTRSLDKTFLHGVTRDSILKLGQHLGYRISERHLTPDFVFDWIKTGEAALSGTAAVLAGVGTIVHQGREYVVGDGQVGRNTKKLRQALRNIQSGLEEDLFSWTTPLD